MSWSCLKLTITALACSGQCIEEDTEQDADFSVPLRFRLSGSPNGKPDLQMQLLRLDFGADARGSSVDRSKGSRKLLTAPTAHGEKPDGLRMTTVQHPSYATPWCHLWIS